MLHLDYDVDDVSITGADSCIVYLISFQNNVKTDDNIIKDV